MILMMYENSQTQARCIRTVPDSTHHPTVVGTIEEEKLEMIQIVAIIIANNGISDYFIDTVCFMLKTVHQFPQGVS